MSTREQEIRTIIGLICFLVGGAVGYWMNYADAGSDYQDAAVERGYAEWVVNDNPRNESEWRWIEPEGE